MSRFLDSFRTYFLSATDAPYEYAEAAGLMSICGIAMGRRYLDMGRGIKPNLFFMLAGASTVARKSTSVDFAKHMVLAVDAERVGPRDYTTEGLLRWMAEKDPQTQKTKNKVGIFASEFGSDLARAEAYAGTMTSDMCALYDGEDFTKVRAKSATIYVNNPHVMLFAACAYPMLQKYLDPKDWNNGFLMRFLFCAPNPNTQRPTWAIQPTDPHALRRDAETKLDILMRDLEASKTTHNRMQLDPGAAQMYTQAMSSFSGQKLSPTAQTYRGRFGVNVQKMALLYQLDIDPYMPVTQLAMHHALNFAFQVCWPSFITAHTKTALSDFEGLFFSVLEFMEKRPGILTPRVELAQEFLGNRTLDSVIEYLKKQGILYSQKLGSGLTGAEGLCLTRTIDTAM